MQYPIIYVQTAFQFAVCSVKIAIYCYLPSIYFTYKASLQKKQNLKTSAEWNSYISIFIWLYVQK